MGFRENFYWGNSISSMQTEGAWDAEGKGKSVYDIKEATEISSDWKVATDSYHRYEEDFDYMQDLGMNMYRFQISWSRVNPTGEGAFNEAGIEFYDRFIDSLISRGIEPMICLYHFDMPLHLAEKYNGFLSKEVVSAFSRYGIEMIKRFGHKVKHWITFNEQNAFSLIPEVFESSGYMTGEKSINEAYQIQHNIMMSHTYVANYIHENTDCQISGMLAYQEIYPATCHPKDVFRAREFDEQINNNLLEAFVHGRYLDSFWSLLKEHNIKLEIEAEELDELSKLTSDYLTFSYYATNVIDHKKIPKGTFPAEYLEFGKVDNPYIESTEWNWQIDPLGFRNILNKLYARYHLPVFPIENGIGVIEEWDGKNSIEDDYRIEYHRDHIQEIKNAVEKDGVDVMGYLGWGLIDILSSKGDMRKRYGVVYVNRENHDLKDLARVPKKSYQWFKRVIHTNGENLSNVVSREE
ncbi:glycoside hydrolase family 1 protein [Marinilactibacillus psychrotolerans]|uniref:6-phospho-beta-glucosidase n=1 Tax=Marinilactibacillus psychrotolerans TaxID=191770 RepID=A0AAV3WQG7_9LACT|nr:glycoside hydrolase family 1 protein [Marinilactibacillus psychrotolerans]GEL67106.1 6-phospho-beta-glucosidase [Marinilactibacillus psychrotolerans]GEQ35481.1 6-phospho-beta-glucosidase [Marinilactibacillus psychrotolerans]SDD44932.1 6-phospho-beta-glucosidase [Marinilactibacillus psychrotolerans]